VVTERTRTPAFEVQAMGLIRPDRPQYCTSTSIGSGRDSLAGSEEESVAKPEGIRVSLPRMRSKAAGARLTRQSHSGGNGSSKRSSLSPTRHRPVS
jgi:hypothetical protein